MKLSATYRKSIEAQRSQPETKKKKAAEHAGAGHTCGECKYGEWAKKELDVTGSPFMTYCHKGRAGYSIRKKCNVTLRSSDACDAFCAGYKPFEQ